MRKIASEGVFSPPEKGKPPEVVLIRDGSGMVVETWRVKNVWTFDKSKNLEEIEFKTQGYRDVAHL